MRQSKIGAFALLFSFGLVGCSIHHYVGSAASPESPQQRCKLGRVAKVNLDGLHLEIQVQNISPKLGQEALVVPLAPSPSGRPTRPLLRIWLNIICEGAPCSVDPMRVALAVDGGDVVYPFGYSGPGLTDYVPSWLYSPWYHHSCGVPKKIVEASHASRAGTLWAAGPRWVECFNCTDEVAPAQRTGVLVTPIRQGCFVLFFDTDPSAEHRFTLSLESVSISGERVNVPDMTFEKCERSEVELPPFGL